jgi:hypothetical protein
LDGLFDKILEFKSEISIRAVRRNSFPQIINLLIIPFPPELEAKEEVEERGSKEAPNAGI